MKKFAIIGGTGVYSTDGDGKSIREVKVETPYGAVTVEEQEYKDNILYFLNRHGKGHSVPPHKVNYRGNIWALKELGVDTILATAAVGSLNRDYGPGTFVFPDQYLEFTKQRQCTFFDGGEAGVVHTDMTEAFCPQVRAAYLAAANEIGHQAVNGGTYVCTEGPRFETPGEIRMFAGFGGDLVGMTAYPECALAHELGICYATLAFVTNYAAGIAPHHLTHEEVLEATADIFDHLQKVLFGTIDKLIALDNKTCKCGNTPEAM